MKTLLEKSEKEPLIAIRGNGLLEIIGKKWIIDTNSKTDYDSLVSKIKAIEKEGKIKNAMVEIEYFNTSASKYLVEILRILDPIPNSTIHWFCDDDDESLIEAGEDLQRILKSELLICTHK